MKHLSIDKKKWIYTGIILLLLGATAAGGWFLLRSKPVLGPQVDVDQMDAERSKILVTGMDYDLHDDQQKEIDKEIEEEKKKEEERKKKEEKKKKEGENKKKKDKDKDEDKSRSKARKKKEAPSTPKKKKSKAWEKAAPTEDNVKRSKKATEGDEKSRNSDSDIPPDDNSEPVVRDESPGAGDVEEPEDVRNRTGDAEEDSYYDLPEEERRLLPTIATSIIDGQTKKGAKLKFWVTATDYKSQNIPVFSNGDGHFEVYLNGEKLSSSGTSDEKTYFRSNAVEGQNTVKITATDRRGKQRTITRKVNCRTGESEAPVGEVTVTIRADEIGVGTIVSGQTVEITSEESVRDILEKVFQDNGIRFEMSSNYLRGIKKSGIARDAEITDELREKAKEERVTLQERENWPNGWADRLYEKDFCSSSGWHYWINDYRPDKGIGDFVPEDGDEIVLEFKLFF